MRWYPGSGGDDIRVDAIAEDQTVSRMTAGTFADPQWTQPTLTHPPAGGLGGSQDIAITVLFLAGGA